MDAISKRAQIGSLCTAGEAHDATAYDDLMEVEDTRPKALIADRGYDSDAIREDVWFHGTNPIIPTKSNRKVQRPIDPALFGLRNRIERFFNKLKNARRVATRYDKTADASSQSSNSPQSKSGCALSTGPS